VFAVLDRTAPERVSSSDEEETGDFMGERVGFGREHDSKNYLSVAHTGSPTMRSPRNYVWRDDYFH
jgi:hypothetical protein